jgi:hypothetical protein
MGYDVYSRVVVGYIVSKEDTIEVRKVRACKHETNLNSKFCSECGKPVYKEEELSLLDEYTKNDNFTVFTFGSEERDYAIGIGGHETETYGSLSSLDLNTLPKDLNAYALKVKDELAEYGIEVDEDDFGVHSVVTHSY